MLFPWTWSVRLPRVPSRCPQQQRQCQIDVRLLSKSGEQKQGSLLLSLPAPVTHMVCFFYPISWKKGQAELGLQ